MGFLGKLFDKPPTKDAFARIAADQMVACGWPEPIYEPADFLLRIGTTQEICGLENAYRSYLQQPKGERAAFLERWFSGIRNMRQPQTFDEARDMLLPMVRQRGEWLNMKVPNPETLLKPSRFFSEDLRLALALDRPTTVSVVNEANVTTWGVDEDALYEAALHNLRLKSADAWSQPFPGVFVSGWRDTFDATRAIFTDLIRRVPIEGEPVIMTPNRNHLFVASRRDETAVQRMVTAAAELFDAGDYSLSMQPLTLEDETCVPYTPTGPAANEVRKRVLSVLATTYANQKQRFESTTEVFYATLMLATKTDTGETLSVGTWAKDVDTLLPRADRIAFVRAKGDVASVAWEEAESIVGPLVAEPGPWPPRYHVTMFPDDEQYAKLKAIEANKSSA